MPRNPNCTKPRSARRGGAPPESAKCFDIGDVEAGTDGSLYMVRKHGKTHRWVMVVSKSAAKRSRTNKSPDPQWNIFTGGRNEEVQKKLRRACRSGPIYVSIDLSLRKNGLGDEVTVLFICLDADTFPADLKSFVRHLSKYNDRPWVVEAEKSGVYEGVDVWKLSTE